MSRNEDLENINNYYFDWLCDIVENSKGEYNILLRYLFDTEFSNETAIFINNDSNRVEDSLDLREDFINEQLSREELYLVETFLHQECSLLEVMISLAYRMEDVMGLDEFPNWFWIMISNLGLDEFTDDHFTRKNLDTVERKVSNLLNREYFRDGTGGLFPLKDPNSDQRKVEIWYQMSAYLIENYS